jgi:hypothetical protein
LNINYDINGLTAFYSHNYFVPINVLINVLINGSKQSAKIQAPKVCIKRADKLGSQIATSKPLHRISAVVLPIKNMRRFETTPFMLYRESR